MPADPVLQRAAELLALSDDELLIKGAAAGLVERLLAARRRRAELEQAQTPRADPRWQALHQEVEALQGLLALELPAPPTSAAPSAAPAAPAIALAGQDITIGGDVVGRDKIITNIQTIVERALTAAEQAEQEKSLEARYLAQGVTAFVRRLQAQAGETADTETGSPYKGLLEYRLSDAEIFFGRDSALRELLKCLASGPLTVLQSESGAGKTSLLQAGLSARLIALGHLPVYLRPYNADPALVLKRAFLSDPGVAPLLATAPLRDFLRQVGEVLGPAATLYILLDQFEEFFTQRAVVEQAEFVRELAECLDDASLNVRWLLALRTEYFGHLAGFRPRLRNPFENNFRLARLSRDEARMVITAPAARRGVTFEPGLVETLLDDLGRHEIAPPQMQLVCATLYDELDEGETVIGRALYERLGGAAGILRGHLERVLSRELPREQRAAARRLLESLISSEQRRVLRTHAELAAELSARGVTAQTLDVILNQLIDNRLVRVQDGDDGPVYELAHDYLLGEINLDPDVQARKAAQELLEQELRAYRRFQTLISAERLAAIEPYRADLTLTPEAEQLLALSQAEARREQVEEAERRRKELEDARRLAEETEARRQAEAARAREAEAAAQRTRRLNRLIAGVGLTAVLAAVVAVFFLFDANASRDAAARTAATAQAANTQSAQNLATAEAARAVAVTQQAAAEAARAQAIAEGERAEQEAHRALTALSGQVAAQAVAASRTSPPLGVLLALEALNITAQSGAAPLPSAEAALRQTLQGLGGRGLGAVTQMNAAGRWLVTRASDGQVRLHDFAAPDPFQAGRSLAQTNPFTGRSQLSPDGRWLLLNAPEGERVNLWPLDGGPPSASPHALDAPGCMQDFSAPFRFSPDGRWLVCRAVTELRVWDLSAEDPSAAGPATAPATPPASLPSDLLNHIEVGPRWLAVDDDGVATVWDIESLWAGTPVSLTVTTGGWVGEAIRFSPDGRWLAAGDPFTPTVRVWDLAALAAADAASAQPSLQLATFADRLDFSADGRWLITASGSDTMAWDMTQPDPSAEPRGLGGGQSLLSPDRRWALVNRGSELLLWDLDTALDGEPAVLVISEATAGLRRPAPGKPGLARPASLVVLGETASFQVDGDGRWVIVFGPDAVADGGFLLWDLWTAPTPLVMRGHESFVAEAFFSPDGRWLATHGGDGAGRLWSLEPFTESAYPYTLPGRDAQLSADGRWLAAREGGDVFVWETPTLTQTRTPLRIALPGTTFTQWQLSPDGPWLLVVPDAGPAQLWPLSAGAEPVSLASLGQDVAGFSVSAGGRWLYVASFAPPFVRLWDLNRPDEAPRDLPLPNTDLPPEAVFSADGQRFFALEAGAGDLGRVTWLDLAAPDAAPQVFESPDLAYGAEFSPGRRWLFAGALTTTPQVFRLWDLNAPAPFARPLPLSIRQEELAAPGAVITPDDRWLVVVFEDQSVGAWNLEDPDAEPIRFPAVAAPDPAVIITADGRFLVRRERGQISVWDLSRTDFTTPTLRVSMDLELSWGMSLRVSPDRRWLALAETDLRVYELTPAPEGASLAARQLALSDLNFDQAFAFTSDGAALAGLDWQGRARLWPLKLEAVMALACPAAGRNLTGSEWERYFPGQEYRRTCALWPADDVIP
mgnify:CR=1 FL=1